MPDRVDPADLQHPERPDLLPSTTSCTHAAARAEGRVRARSSDLLPFSVLLTVGSSWAADQGFADSSTLGTARPRGGRTRA